MKIKEKTIYSINGKDFKSLTLLKKHVENQIGAIIDRVKDSKGGRLPPAIKLAMLDILVSNRAALTKWLNIEYETTSSCSDWHGIHYIDKNILDD